MSIYIQIYNEFGDWRLLVVCLILMSFSFKRGLRNSKYWEGVYKRNEQERKRDKFFKKMHKKRWRR